MEPLQAAIQKARENRLKAEKAAEPAPDPVHENPEPAEEASGPELQSPWAALKAFDPNARILKRHRIVAAETGNDAAPYDMLRTRILQLIRKNGWKRILITSPDVGCGKTTISVNLAARLARNPEIRTMLFDLDLRQPMIGKVLGLRRSNSLHQVLDGSIAFTDHAVTMGENLIVSSNLGPARNPSELLQSDHTAEILDQVEQTYQPDIMLFDMPPLSGSDDTYGFLRRVDCCILVAAAESTTIEQIDTSEQEVAAEKPVLGVVLNKCRYSENQYGYGY